MEVGHITLAINRAFMVLAQSPTKLLQELREICSIYPVEAVCTSRLYSVFVRESLVPRGKEGRARLQNLLTATETPMPEKGKHGFDGPSGTPVKKRKKAPAGV